jgi:hypothetical protein
LILKASRHVKLLTIFSDASPEGLKFNDIPLGSNSSRASGVQFKFQEIADKPTPVLEIEQAELKKRVLQDFMPSQNFPKSR